MQQQHLSRLRETFAGKIISQVLLLAGEVKGIQSRTRTGASPEPPALRHLRQITATLFMVAPIVAVDGRAVFVSKVPSVKELKAAVAAAVPASERREDEG